MSKLSPFDHSKIILKKSVKPSDFEGYSQWMINKIFSCDDRLVFFAQIADSMEISDIEHFDFYYYAIPRSNKYIPYLAKKTSKVENIEFVAKHFDIGMKEAESYVSFMSKSELQEITSMYEHKEIQKTKVKKK